MVFEEWEYKPSVAFYLGSPDHDITVFYDSQVGCGRLIDANKVPSKTYQSDEKFAQAILNSFFEKNLVLHLLQSFIVIKIRSMRLTIAY